MIRRSTLPLVAVAAVLALTSCGDDDDDATGATGASSADTATETTGDAIATTMSGDSTMTAESTRTRAGAFTGTLAEAAGGGDALTYDATQAPVGAELAVTVEQADGETTYTLTVAGMQPDRGYAVHAHVNACGPTGDVAGPHFQNEVDPAATPDAPSTDPAYANPENEVWLDLATDAEGAGTATATVPFTFAAEAPQAVVVHADEMTMTQPGMAGMAGDRIACITTPL